MLKAGIAQPVDYRSLFPAPLFSSRARGWKGVQFEVYRLGDHEFLGAHPEHIVSIQASSCPRLYQRRAARVSERPMLPGEVIVTPSGEPKHWRREGGGVILLMTITPDFLHDLQEQVTGQSGRAELLDNFGTRDALVEAFAETMWGELRSDLLGSRMYAQALCMQFGLHLLRNYASAPLCSDCPVRISSHKLRLARAFIEDRISEDLNVETIAREVGMSPFHFAHAFKAATGMPPHRFVMLRRLEAARALLRNTRLPLAEIAERVGYSSASHFSAGFHKLAGMSPTAYRKDPGAAPKIAGLRTPPTRIRIPARKPRG